MTQTLRRLAGIKAAQLLAVAAAYYITGRLGVLQAIPPGYATPIWPPSGVALAGLLIFGYRVWPGIALGSFLVNVGTAAPSPTLDTLLRSAGIAAVIAAGATAQACAGAALIRRFVGYPTALDEPRDVVKFLALGGPAACLVNATVAVTALVVTGTIRWVEFPQNWATWWLGDSLGVVVVTPLLLTFGGMPREAWRTRRMSVGLPLVGIMALAVLLFVRTSAWEQDAVRFDFENRSAQLASGVRMNVDGALDALYSVGSLFASTPQVDRQAFHIFGDRLLAREPDIKAIEWIPRVRLSERDAYREAARRDGYPLYNITERTPAGKLVVAPPRTEYFPVYYAEPAGGNLAALGFDLASNPTRRAALETARDTDTLVASGRVVLVQETARSNGILVYLPIYQRGFPVRTLEARRQYLEGFAVLVLRMNDVVAGALAGHGTPGITLRVEDRTAPPADALLWGPPSPPRDGAGSLAWAADLGVGGRRWRMETFAGPGYFAGHRAWQSWAVLTLALLFNGLLGALLLIVTGRTLKTEARALRTTELYERAHYVAETLQHAFLPVSLPSVLGGRVDAAYLQGSGESRVGGDWYDVFQLPDGRLALSIGDVVGQGLPAAIVMGQLRQSIRVAAMIDPEPSAVLDRAHDQLLVNPDIDAMATAMFAVYDPVTQILAYASAGHPYAVRCTSDGTVHRLTSDTGPLGMEAQYARATHSASLPPGALLVLYTDGLVETSRALPDEEAFLFRVVRSAARQFAADHAHEILREMLRGRTPADDIAAVTLAVAPGLVERVDLTLPALAGSVRLARQAVRQLTARLGVSDSQGQKIGVVLSEAVSNAVEHAYGAATGTVTVRAWRDGRWLRAEIEDHGRWRAPRSNEYRGYGIPTMRALADRVEIDRRPAGTLVRLAVSLSDTAPDRVVEPRPMAPAAAAVVAAARAGEPAGRPAVGHHEPQAGANLPADADRSPGAPADPVLNGADAPSFRVRSVNGVPVVEIPEEVDLSNVHRLRAVLEDAARADRRAVVVSFDGVAFFDSHAMHALLRFNRRLEMNRQRLVAVVPKQHPLKVVLHVLEVAPNVSVAESLTEAVAAARAERT